MADIMIEQALYLREVTQAPRLLGRSSGFRDEWLAEAERLVTGFGDRPAGALCPAALFAQPLDNEHVAVVQVADQALEGPNRFSALGFRMLVLPRAGYIRL